MHEISPVLAGANTTPNQMMVAANFNASNAAAPADAAASSTSQVDDRRYTKFDRTASNAGTDTTFTFSDFLDMVNPLQHIPVVSSAYREAEGETINPVARVAGDMAFGGIFGVASIIASGVGAVSDSILEQQGGKDRATSVLASLFGSDDKTAPPPTTQLASASSVSQQPVVQGAIQPQVGAPAQASMASATQAPPTSLLANAKGNTKSAVASATTLNNAVAQNDGSKGFPFTNKLPYGGVIPPTATMQDQNMAMALAESSHSMRMGNMIYTNRFMNGPKPLPVASQTASTNATTSDAPAPASAASPPPVAAQATPTVGQTDVAAAPQKNSIPQALMDDMLMMKALDQYRSLGGATPVPGSNLDVTN